METIEGTEREQASWHISSDVAKYIASLIVKGTGYYLKGDLGNWFWHFGAIRDLIDQDLDDAEKANLDKQEKELSPYYNEWTKYKKAIVEGDETARYEKGRSNFVVLVRIYVRLMMALLKRTGYLPAKEDKTKLNF